ncbi:YwdI family protein [Rummeliibacillus stabekisii]|uniref:YwdI family protein n=1 Tax=Rummeliibacillus stabekisii TaxID=241244 RepID=UPI00203BE873|nr:YwdI family protein [Rummeliibacillus stabekisii]MCM3315167.1 YwdI family protein [Rummeliibacillus stabekisii]
MISYDAVIRELEKHIHQAGQRSSEAKMREELSAIRALCDLALQSDKSPTPHTVMPKMIGETVQDLSHSSVSSMPKSLTANKLEEEDANGDSLFDF